MSLSRRHDKLIRRLLAVKRERAEVEARGLTGMHVDRLLVRERALTSAVRRIRLQLGLPQTFDALAEATRLDSEGRRSRRRSRRAANEPLFTERQRVKPVPAARPEGAVDNRFSLDAPLELVSHAARYCARRAAEELLDHRQSPARGHVGVIDPWPATPLARTESGEIFAGSAGPLIGELVSRGFDADEARAYARVAVRSYVDEFVMFVVAALRREWSVADQLGRSQTERPPADLGKLERDLARAACSRIAAEVRTARRGRTFTADEIAGIGGLNTDAPVRRPAPIAAGATDADGVGHG